MLAPLRMKALRENKRAARSWFFSFMASPVNDGNGARRARRFPMFSSLSGIFSLSTAHGSLSRRQLCEPRDIWWCGTEDGNAVLYRVSVWPGQVITVAAVAEKRLGTQRKPSLAAR